MSNGNRNSYERVLKIFTSVMRLVIEGKRSIDRVGDALQEILENRGQDTLRFPVWKTVELGIGPQNGEGFVQALGKAEILITETAVNALCSPQFQVADRKEVKLVKVTLRDLNLPTRRIHFSTAVNVAMSLGLKLCPDEVAPALLLQNKLRNMKCGDYVKIASLPIPGDQDIKDYSVTFIAGPVEGGYQLATGSGTDCHIVGPDVRMIFVSP
ncbi:MAG: hypothetical protein JWL80_266 [Parcubacteria group bacterium]|nr:hypothetical protein [Parcubacteria group bacterium]